MTRLGFDDETIEEMLADHPQRDEPGFVENLKVST